MPQAARLIRNACNRSYRVVIGWSIAKNFSRKKKFIQPISPKVRRLIYTAHCIVDEGASLGFGTIRPHFAKNQKRRRHWHHYRMRSSTLKIAQFLPLVSWWDVTCNCWWVVVKWTTVNPSAKNEKSTIVIQGWRTGNMRRKWISCSCLPLLHVEIQ